MTKKLLVENGIAYWIGEDHVYEALTSTECGAEIERLTRERTEAIDRLLPLGEENERLRALLIIRPALLLDAAHDCQCVGEQLRLDAPNVGPIKQARYMAEAEAADKRADALRAWVTEIAEQEKAEQSEPVPPPGSLADQIAAAQRCIAAWPADVRIAMGLPESRGPAT